TRGSTALRRTSCSSCGVGSFSSGAVEDGALLAVVCSVVAALSASSEPQAGSERPATAAVATATDFQILTVNILLRRGGVKALILLARAAKARLRGQWCAADLTPRWSRLALPHRALAARRRPPWPRSRPGCPAGPRAGAAGHRCRRSRCAPGRFRGFRS